MSHDNTPGPSQTLPPDPIRIVSMTTNFPTDPEPSFIGLPSFLKLPYVTDPAELKRLAPDVAIMGAPFDMGTTIRPGTRFGPRAIRQAAGYVGGSPVEPMYHVSLKVAPFAVLEGRGLR